MSIAGTTDVLADLKALARKMNDSVPPPVPDGPRARSGSGNSTQSAVPRIAIAPPSETTRPHRRSPSDPSVSDFPSRQQLPPRVKVHFESAESHLFTQHVPEPKRESQPDINQDHFRDELRDKIATKHAASEAAREAAAKLKTLQMQLTAAQEKMQLLERGTPLPQLMSQERLSFEQQRGQMQQLNDEAHNRILSQESIIAELQSQLQQSHAKNRSLQHELSGAQQMIVRLRENDKVMAKLRDDLRTTTDELQAERNETAQLRLALDSIKASELRLQAELTFTREQTLRSQTESAEKLNVANQSIQVLNSRIAHLSGEVGETLCSLAVAQQAADNAKAQLAISQASEAITTAALVSAQQSVLESQESVITMQQQLTEARSQALTEMNNVRKQSQQDIAAAKRRNEADLAELRQQWETEAVLAYHQRRQESGIVRHVATNTSALAGQKATLGIGFVPVPGGLRATTVKSGSGASLADIRPGDVLITLNEESVCSLEELRKQLARHDPGEIITCLFIRAGKPQTRKIELGAGK
eukprot:TRINITY_DN2312_c0_g1_i2.p1 TRINITY_DN2312_c0_g1~~TRINITY_DN2312_c0_g1_i2.p1  ORF type:complete len:531 (+),score=123.22 TRINITY_DN2312_c0_g1_i2:167-1759(+)